MKKLFKIFFILFSFIINYQFLYAQVNLEWAREYYYNYSDNKAKCVAVDNEGNSIVTGTVLGSGIDIVTLRYNSGGDLLWSRIYTNANQYNSDDGVSDLVVDEQRNIYITGYTANSVSANRNIVTIKYSPAGDSLWVKHYAGAANGNDEGKAIALDNSGNVYVTGYSTGAGTNADYITIKYDSLGNELWVNKYNYFTNNADISNAIDVDERGNVYVTGQSEYSYLTIKYDSNGNLKWDKRYNAGSSTDIGISLEADIYGNVYVTGTSHIYGGFNNEDFATIKYDSLGNILWSKRYNSNGIDNAVSLKVVYEFDFNFPSDVIVTGTSSNDYLTIKYDGHDGDSLWVKRYNGPSNSLEVVSALAADNSGNVYVTGYSYDNATKNDFVTIMYDGIYGDELWNQRYHTSGNTNEKATDIALGPDGSVFVTGEYNPFTNIFKTVKYKGPTPPVVLGDSIMRYNGPGNPNDFVSAMEIDDFGNIYVAGTSLFNSSSSNFVTVKYNSFGDSLWVNKFRGPANLKDECKIWQLIIPEMFTLQEQRIYLRMNWLLQL
ncbi:MAG: SBBP repeat-containing protein [Ignavibacteria bacterium]|nr:SBBP repeat-containing protein [Ignavibacteria bacterium]